MSKTAISAYLSLITLNENGLNGLIKKYRVGEWIPPKMCIDAEQKRLISDLKTHADWKWNDISSKWKGTKKSWCCNAKCTLKQNCRKKQRGILYNDNRVNPTRNIIIVNIYAPNIGALKYIKQLLTHIKGKIGTNTIIVEDLING